MFGRSVVGKIFRVNGVEFRVIAIDPYPKSRVSERYKAILSFRPGLLVAVPYRGILIPNITLSKGVVRLIEVEVDGEVYKTPKTISQALKVLEAMCSYDLLRL
jgi:hypothetical protein